MLIGNRYKLHESLGAGGMGTVYRATDRLTGQTVALKQVALNSAGAFFSSDTAAMRLRLSLAREFQTLASLRHPHIISVLDYGFDSNHQPFFTMTLLNNAEPITDAAANLSIEGKLQLLIQLLQALAYLHRRGILHRDLKPGNVLVENKEEVRVLDFGLAIAHQQQTDEAAGTIAYMAPEVITNHPISTASDLFAVGIMAYEMFTGQHPFDTSSIPALLRSILHDSPDLALVDSPRSTIQTRSEEQTLLSVEFKSLTGEEDTLVTLDPASLTLEDIDTNKLKLVWADNTPQTESSFDLPTIIGRLLAKEPQDRYQDAYEVIRDLSQSMEQSFLEESEAIRESFLQAATFVGRDMEFDQLKTALSSAMQGQGSVWLVGGESGVGKSRLLDELRTYGLVQGAMVIRGQSVAEGGVPYQLWREPLRRLVISRDPSNNQASVLKEIIPDIDTLLEREIPDPPILEGKAKQQRLHLTIADIFRKHDQPILLLLEDLHWAGISLLPLQQLTQIADQLDLLVVANYRQDEKPDLPDELPGTQLLQLKRLSKENISELSVSMLGEAGRQKQLLEFLQRETEGNVYFMVETVRALAEEVGRLSDVGLMQLPQQIFAGGVRRIVQRRLERVPTEYRSLLKLAAVAGRRIDLSILQVIDHEADFDTWLLICSNVAVIDQQDGNWRFAHDKLREALINELVDDEPQTLHRQVAEAIEQIYPNDAAQARVLMEHWHHAQNTEKESFYARVAGEQAHAISNLKGALELFERALSLTPTQESAIRATILVKLGKVYANLSQYADATQCLNTGLNLAQQTNHNMIIVEALNELGWVAEQQGAFDEAQKFALQALENANPSENQPGIAQALKNLGNVYRVRGDYDEAKKHYEESLLIRRKTNDQQGMAVVLNNLGITAYIRGDLKAAHDYLAEALAIHKQIGARYEMAAGLDNLGIISATRGDPETANQYLEESLVIRRDIGDRSGVASALNNLGVIAKDQGHYAEAHEYFEESLFIRREIGDRAGLTSSLNNLGAVAASQNQYETARRYFREALVEATALDAVPLILEAVVEVANLEEKAGNYEQAVLWLSTALHHPALDTEVKRNIERILKELQERLPVEKIENALQQGNTVSLETVVQAILQNS